MKKWPILLFLLLTFCLFASDAKGRVVYASLSDAEKELYLNMERCIEEKKQNLESVPPSLDTNMKVLLAYLSDNPEVYFVKPMLNYEETTQGKKFVSNRILFTYEHLEDLASFDEALASKTRTNVSALKALPSDYARLLAIYTFLASKTVYDLSYPDQGIYSVFVSGKGVCSGFARAFQYLASAIDIDTIYVSGYLKEDPSVSHAWALALLDGHWCHFDPTLASGKDGVNYDYFAISDETIAKTHTIDNSYPIPPCNTDALSYSHQMGWYSERYTLAGAENIIHRSLARDDTDWAFEYGSAIEEAKAYSALIEKKAIFTILEKNHIEGADISYSRDKRRHIIHIHLKPGFTRFSCLEFDTYRYKDVLRSIKETIKEKDESITLEFTNAEAYQTAQKKLIEEQGLFTLLSDLGKKAQRASYSTSDTLQRIKIFLPK